MWGGGGGGEEGTTPTNTTPKTNKPYLVVGVLCQVQLTKVLKVSQSVLFHNFMTSPRLTNCNKKTDLFKDLLLSRLFREKLHQF